MKTLGLILLGSILTVGTQAYLQSDYSIINTAEAAGDRCLIVGSSSDSMFLDGVNNAYRQGYRVEGFAMVRLDDGYDFNRSLMCK